MAVTIERSLAIRSPLKTSPLTWQTKRFVGVILSIFFFTFLICLYSHFDTVLIPWGGCENRTADLVVYDFKPNPLHNATRLFKTYLEISPILGAIFVIFVPLIGKQQSNHSKNTLISLNSTSCNYQVRESTWTQNGPIMGPHGSNMPLWILYGSIKLLDPSA